MKASELLEAAKTYMETHGRCRGVYEAPDGRVCMLGAMRRALRPEGPLGGALFGQDFPEYRKGFRFLKEVVLFADPVAYNDNEGTETPHVLEKFEKAARRARELGD